MEANVPLLQYRVMRGRTNSGAAESALYHTLARQVLAYFQVAAN